MRWPEVPIGDLVTVRGGGTPKRSNEAFFQGNIPWVTPKDMKRWEIQNSQIKITPEAIDRSATNLIPSNTVLLVVRSGVLKHTVPVAINRRPVAINQDMKSLECSDRLLPEYLARYLKESEPIILSWVRATTADNYPIDNIRQLPIPLPPLDEQRRIAAILDQADDLRHKRRKALRNLLRAARIIFLDMFGDPISNKRGWRTIRLGEAGTLDRGVSKHRPRNDPILLGGPYPLIQTGDITNCDGYVRTYAATYSEQGLKQSRLWPAGTLCITIAANIGNTGILTFEACFPDSIVGFAPNSLVRTEFIQQWFAFVQPGLEKDAPQFAQKNINLAILRALELPLPPLDMQRIFADSVVEIDKLKSVQRCHLAKLDATFASLQRRGFKGEL